MLEHLFTTQPDKRHGNEMKVFTRTALIGLLLAAVISGIWLNRTAWKNRRLIWQLQAALVAGGVGFIAGRLSAPGRKD